MTPTDAPNGRPIGSDGTGDGHVTDDLPLLLGGELDRRQLSVVVGHLRQCFSCRAELVEATGAHSALTATRRVLDPRRSLVGGEDAADSAVAGSVDDLPPLAIGARGRPVMHSRRRRGRDLLVGLSAAAAAVVITLGGVAAQQHWSNGSSASQSTTAASRQAALTPVVAPSGSAPIPDASGVVKMRGTREVVMTIRVTGLPPAAAGHFYYAWLLDASTNKMLPVGVVSSTGVATFDLGSDLVQRYTAVDISVQADNGDPAHSAESVLRASYA